VKPSCPFCGYVYDDDAPHGELWRCPDCQEFFRVGDSQKEASASKSEFEEKRKEVHTDEGPSSESPPPGTRQGFAGSTGGLPDTVCSSGNKYSNRKSGLTPSDPPTNPSATQTNPVTWLLAGDVPPTDRINYESIFLCMAATGIGWFALATWSSDVVSYLLLGVELGCLLLAAYVAHAAGIYEREEARAYFGCFSKTTWQPGADRWEETYTLHPFSVGRPLRGTAKVLVKCPRCGETVTMLVRSAIRSLLLRLLVATILFLVLLVLLHNPFTAFVGLIWTSAGIGGLERYTVFPNLAGGRGGHIVSQRASKNKKISCELERRNEVGQDETERQHDKEKQKAEETNRFGEYNATVAEVYDRIKRDGHICDHCRRSAKDYKLSEGLRDSHGAYTSKSLIICRGCGHVVEMDE
jgi:hypothetical protein